MKTKNTQKTLKQGFTLLELLVVVLIIGILASIALPQYQMAVTKAKVASILPLMRRWKDALAEYKLQHGYYGDINSGIYPDGSDLGVNWPSDWKIFEGDPCGDNCVCDNDYWHCAASEEGNGQVYCEHEIDANNVFIINIYQPDDEIYEDYRGMMTCSGKGTEGNKVCKALGGKLIQEDEDFNTYQLN